MIKELKELERIDYKSINERISLSSFNPEFLSAVAFLLLQFLDAIHNIVKDKEVKWYHFRKVTKIIRAVLTFIVGIRGIK